MPARARPRRMPAPRGARGGSLIPHQFEHVDGTAETSGPARASPSSRYAADLAAGRIQADPAQALAVARLEHVYGELLAHPDRRATGLLDRLRGRRPPPWTAVRGLYLWGRSGAARPISSTRSTSPAGDAENAFISRLHAAYPPRSRAARYARSARADRARLGAGLARAVPGRIPRRRHHRCDAPREAAQRCSPRA